MPQARSLPRALREHEGRLGCQLVSLCVVREALKRKGMRVGGFVWLVWFVWFVWLG